MLSLAWPIPFPFIIHSCGGGKEGLVEACTSFRVIPLDSWGNILSMYCLCRGVAFRDVELNTRIKTALSSLQMLFWWRWIIKLERAVALEHGYIHSSKQGEAILAFLQNQDVFISLPAGYGKSLCYSLLPPMYDKLRSVVNK